MMCFADHESPAHDHGVSQGRVVFPAQRSIFENIYFLPVVYFLRITLKVF